MNLRERKKARTRRALGEAAVELFLARGFDNTTIEDIVAAAGVSRRTFFRYFPSKEAAFFAGHDDRLELFEAMVKRQAAADGAWKAVCDALLEIAVAYEADRDGAVAWRQAMRSSTALVAYDLQMDASWEAVIAKVFKAEGNSAFEASTRAGAVMGVVRAVLIAWYEGQGSDDLIAQGRLALRWLSDGLAGEAPR